MKEFIQTGPSLENTYLEDKFIQSFVKRYFPKKYYDEINSELTRLGKRMASDILKMAESCEENPPQLISYNPWGKRIDQIKVDPCWEELDKVSAVEGIVATGYERNQQEYSRVFQFLKLYLFHASSAYYSCPLAMTDGAAKLIELSSDQKLKSKAFKHLTSRDPNLFWTSGQWMTERSGGSDVGGTETIARLIDGKWKLFGTKWFTSATTSQMAMTLARIEENGKVISGSKGLSLFYLELRDENDELNGIEILRLKDKLGTKALPTAELKLNGSNAILVGERGSGVKTISSLFNVTRIYNSCCANSAMRRILSLSKDYSKKREAFGKTLDQHPLHLETLANLEIDTQACTHLTLYVAELLGKEELNKASKEESALLRLLTPVTKLYTAKENLKATSELVESFGGAGYVEDVGISKWLRDAQVLSIWEGTTNVLSLDVLRALSKECSLEIFIQKINEKLAKIEHDELLFSKEIILASLKTLGKLGSEMNEKGAGFSQIIAREFSFSLARILAGTLMLEHARDCLKEEAIFIETAKRFCSRDLCKGLELSIDHDIKNQTIFKL